MILYTFVMYEVLMYYEGFLPFIRVVCMYVWCFVLERTCDKLYYYYVKEERD